MTDLLAPAVPLDWKMYAVYDDIADHGLPPRWDRVAEIDEFNKATFILRLNDVGSFTIDSDPKAAGIRTAINPPPDARYPNARVCHIELTIDGRTVFIGPIQGVERSAEPTRQSTTVFGRDHNVYLAQRIVAARNPRGTTAPTGLPFPTSFASPPLWSGPAPPWCGAYQFNAAERLGYDLFTGPANQALAHYAYYNAGPGAAFSASVARRKLNFVLPGQGFGAEVSVAGRYQNLLEFLQGIAIQAGEWPLAFSAAPWTFTVAQPADRGAFFSPDLGNVRSFVARYAVDDLNFAYVAGQGEEEERMIATNPGYGANPGAGVPIAPVYPGLGDSGPYYGLVEGFRDRRDTDDWPTLQGAAVEDCRAGIQRPRVLAAALDTAAQRYGRDYNLGDIVTVRFDGVDTKVLVTALAFNLEPGRPPTVTPTLGTDVAVAPLNLIKRVDGQAARINQLERR